MELKFLLDKNARKLLYINELLSNRKMAEGMMLYPHIFGEPFTTLAKVREYYWKTQKYFDELVNEVESGTADKELLELIEKINSDDDTSLLDSTKRNLLADLKKYEPLLKSNIKSIFGFDFPKTVTVILGQQSIGTAGTAPRLKGGDILIGLLVSPQTKREELVGVLAHEMLHGLISLYKPFSKSNKVNDLEELLLGYMVPSGLLAWRVGLENEFDTEFCYWSSLRGGYSEEVSRKVKAIVEKYASESTNRTIWEEIKLVFPKSVDEKVISALG